MKFGAIITGDIVNSTKLTVEGRDLMLKNLQLIPEVLASVQNVSIEIFRGDSFQLGVSKAESALRCALAIRAPHLGQQRRSHRPAHRRSHAQSQKRRRHHR